MVASRTTRRAVKLKSHPIERLQGGFLTNVLIRTSDLPNPMTGTIVLEDVRIAGDVPPMIGFICNSNDPTIKSSGELLIDVLRGSAHRHHAAGRYAIPVRRAYPRLPALSRQRGAGLRHQDRRATLIEQRIETKGQRITI